MIWKHYNVKEAWKLFVTQGITKADQIERDIIKNWYNSKIRGVQYSLQSLDFQGTSNFQSKILFDSEIADFAHQEDLCFYVFDDSSTLHDKCGFEQENLRVEIGAMLDVNISGISSLHISINSGEAEYTKGAEHYVEALHELIMYTIPIRFENDFFYITSVFSLNSDFEALKKMITKEVKSYGRRLKGSGTQKNWTSINYSTILKINSVGIIKEILHFGFENGEFSFRTSENLLSIFSNVQLNKLMSGEKQISRVRNTLSEPILITPLRKTGSGELEILIEYIDDAFLPFFQMTEDVNMGFLNAKDTEIEDKSLERRIDALLKSDFPIIVVGDYLHEHLLMASLMSKYDDRIVYSLDSDKNSKIFNVILFKEDIAGNKILPHHTSLSVRYHLFLTHDKFLMIKPIFEKKIRHILDNPNIEYKIILHVNNEDYNDILYLSDNIGGRVQMYSFFIDELSQNFLKRASYKIMSEKPYDILSLSNFSNDSNKTMESSLSLGKRKKYELDQAEKNVIVDALVYSDMNISKAASLLGISRTTLYRKIEKYKISIK